MTILPDTIDFLKSISVNNNKDWFQKNKPKYDAALDNIKAFVSAVEKDLNVNDVIEKSKTFRIYRDVRFSKDKAPYKEYFGSSFMRASAARRGGYYLHIEPGNSFVGGGFWAPNPADLKRIRDEFAMDDKPIRKIIADKTFKKYFGSLHGEAVKTAPKGFDKDHPAIDLIRMKQYTVTRQFSDEEVLAKNFQKEVVKTYEAMRPYFDYMSEVLTTDLNGVSLL
ncbi:MAG: DUF2461 domain-containing protein [Saprospiraceae bacterium]